MSEPPQRATIAQADLSVILLIHDDAAVLDEVVAAWVDFLAGLQRNFEIILVEDGSGDGSGSLADRLPERFPQVRVVHHDTHRGQGAALRTGLAEAKFPLLFYTLANKQYQPPDLNQLLAVIDNVDLVTGFRVWQPIPWWVHGLDFVTRWFKRIFLGLPLEPRLSWLGTQDLSRRLLARWLFGVQLHDPQCVYRLLRRDILRRVPIQCDGSFAHVEIAAKVNFLGALMAETAVSFVPGKTEADDNSEAWALFRQPDFGPPILPPLDRPPEVYPAEVSPIEDTRLELPDMQPPVADTPLATVVLAPPTPAQVLPFLEPLPLSNVADKPHFGPPILPPQDKPPEICPAEVSPIEDTRLELPDMQPPVADTPPATVVLTPPAPVQVTPFLEPLPLSNAADKPPPTEAPPLAEGSAPNL